ncbi:MAG: DUF1365 domain-containing protein [Acidimicrobiales bacterium]
MSSALYDGSVTHVRNEPAHRFTYRLMLPLVDTGDIPGVFDGTAGWGTRWWHPARFSPQDYLSPSEARGLVEAATGASTSGPVFQLGHLRTLGWCFNPLTLHFCHDRAGDPTGTVVTVTNTPWGEQHKYVIPAAGTLESSKGGHVSPFLPMGLDYAVRLDQQPDRIDLRIDVEKQGKSVLRTSMNLTRRELVPTARTAALFAPRFHSLRTSAAIYLQAARLKRKGARFHSHPRKNPA